MKYIFLFLLFAATSATTQAQSSDSNDVFGEPVPEFPDGELALSKFVLNHLKYPAEATDKKISGEVVLQLSVDAGGSVTDVKVIQPLEGGCTEEAIRVARALPHWHPAKKRGKAVASTYKLTVPFQYQEGKKKKKG